MRILLAVDGSPISMRAVKYAVALTRQLAKRADMTLFHADPPLPNAIAIKLGPEALKRYHDGNGDYATKAARAALRRAHVGFEDVRVVAEPAEAIVSHARKGRFDLIVMGSLGQSALKGLLLGSVTGKVIAHCEIPVTIAR